MDDSPSWKLPRRHHSISTSIVIPTKLSYLSSTPTTPSKPRHHSSFPSQNGAASTPQHQRQPHLDLDLLSLNSSDSYTSLKDLLPSSAVQSPTPKSANNSGYEISIRNRLVKQAAWAYLQPMSSTCGPSGPNFLRRLWLHCFSFFNRRLLPSLSRTFHCLLPCFRVS